MVGMAAGNISATYWDIPDAIQAVRGELFAVSSEALHILDVPVRLPQNPRNVGIAVGHSSVLNAHANGWCFPTLALRQPDGAVSEGQAQ